MRSAVKFLLSLSIVVALASGCGAAAGDRPKVVVLGFDGADARLVEQWMDEGQLPNMAQLRAEGSYAPLQTDQSTADSGIVVLIRHGNRPGKNGDLRFPEAKPGRLPA